MFRHSKNKPEVAAPRNEPWYTDLSLAQFPPATSSHQIMLRWNFKCRLLWHDSQPFSFLRPRFPGSTTIVGEYENSRSSPRSKGRFGIDQVWLGSQVAPWVNNFLLGLRRCSNSQGYAIKCQTLSLIHMPWYRYEWSVLRVRCAKCNT